MDNALIGAVADLTREMTPPLLETRLGPVGLELQASYSLSDLEYFAKSSSYDTRPQYQTHPGRWPPRTEVPVPYSTESSQTVPELLTSY